MFLVQLFNIIVFIVLLDYSIYLIYCIFFITVILNLTKSHYCERTLTNVKLVRRFYILVCNTEKSVINFC